MSTTESLRFGYQFGHNVKTDNLDSTLRQRTRQPAFSAAEVKHAPRRQARHGLDHGLISDQRPTFNLLVLDGFHPRAGVRMPRSYDLSIAAFRHRGTHFPAASPAVWNAERDEPVECPATSEMTIDSPPMAAPPGGPQH